MRFQKAHCQLSACVVSIVCLGICLDTCKPKHVAPSSTPGFELSKYDTYIKQDAATRYQSLMRQDVVSRMDTKLLIEIVFRDPDGNPRAEDAARELGRRPSASRDESVLQDIVVSDAANPSPLQSRVIYALKSPVTERARQFLRARVQSRDQETAYCACVSLRSSGFQDDIDLATKGIEKHRKWLERKGAGIGPPHSP